ncbi:MAG: ATP-binding protein [Planctomycetaceae bacterium]|nr:ATP-binding protein [Planctomycetaceae bacterium]
MRILAVDDSPTFLELIRTIIEAEFAGAMVESTASLKRASEIVKANGCDAVVLELGEDDSELRQNFEEFRQEFPQLPIILSSIHGFDEQVQKAIELGAEGYVSKAHLHDELPSTLKSVLNALTYASSDSSLSNSLFREQTTKLSLPSHREVVGKIVRYIAQLIHAFNICTSREQMRVVLAVEEALVNAMYHGNLGVASDLRGVDDEAYFQLIHQRTTDPHYADRRVELTITVTNSLAKFVIRDQGAGFDVGQIPDPREDQNLELSHGRGIFLMRTFMDEVIFNSTGNEVIMIKYKSDHINRSSDSMIWTAVENTEHLRRES